MSTFSPTTSFRPRRSTIGLAAFLLIPQLAEGGPTSTVLGTVLGAAGVIELTGPTRPATCQSSDAHLEQQREQLDAASAVSEGSRERVVADHLRVTQEPIATIETTQDQEDLESARAEVHIDTQEVRQDEARLAQQRCSAAPDETSLPPVNSDIVDVRMEFPAKDLQSLERALGSGSAAITAYRSSDRTAITGRLISVESALAGDKPIVIARARLDDSLHQLRDAELVGVAVQLPAA